MNALVVGGRLAWITVSVLLLSSAAVAANAAENPSGWDVYLAARAATGATSESIPIEDYSFDLTTRLDVNGEQVQLTSTVSYVVPGLVRQDIRTPQGDVNVVFDGEKGWRALPAGIQPMPSEAVDRIKADLARSHVMLAPPPAKSDIRYLRSDEVDGKSVHVIEIRDVGGTPLRLYIDTDSNDVVKQMFVGDAPDGSMAQVEEYFSDFREIAGYRWHHVRKVVRNGKPALESITTDLRVNTGLSKADIIR